MLKKANRLTKATDIKTAFARGRTFFSPSLSLKFLAGTPAKRFTVVVSTKVFKSSVKRNRLKRIIREAVRNSLSKFKFGNYVVSLKPKAAHMTELEILNNFWDLVHKIR